MKRGIYRLKGAKKDKKEPGESLGERLARLFEIPGDVYGNRPKVTAIGRGEVLVENFRGIMDFQNGIIRINTNNGIIKVTGDDLTIREITNEEIIIGGKISNIDYDA
ncbi:MAG: sporulation protein YqfC [Acetivibrionales bacterium]|jgi:sporulation protein YqfC|nr:sporulation protein YqfC [Clostridiaceae bacterium]